MQLTLTEALTKLKLTQSKIDDSIGRTPVAFVSTAGSKNLPTGYKTREEYQKEINSRVQQVTDLLAYRDKLKSAISVANATTKVTVGEQTYTLLEAIDKKNSIERQKKLLTHLEGHYFKGQGDCDRMNASLSQRCDQYIQQATNGVNYTSEEIQKLRDKWMEDNKAVLVTDPGLPKLIEKLRNEITEFEANVNTALAVKNAQTLIEV